jgi:hypothetical protein
LKFESSRVRAKTSKRRRDQEMTPELNMTRLKTMKFVFALIFLSLLAGCASRPGPPAMQDRREAKADAKAREEFAKTLPKPRE